MTFFVKYNGDLEKDPLNRGVEDFADYESAFEFAARMTKKGLACTIYSEKIINTVGSRHYYASFDDWYQEIENFSLRAERLTSNTDELRAAFNAGRTETVYLLDLLRRLMSEVRPYTRPSMVQYDVFPTFKEAVDHVSNKD